MKRARFLNAIAIAATSVMHVVVGSSLSGIGRTYRDVYQRISPNGEQPALTNSVLDYTSSSTPLVVGLALAVVSAVVLWFITRREKSDALFPFALVFSWTLGTIHLANCWLGLNMGLISVTNQPLP